MQYLELFYRLLTKTFDIHSAIELERADWERELFRESLSFAGSTGLGMLAVNAGLRLLIFATPYGWAWLIAGGVATAAVSAGSTILFDNLAKQRSDDWYNALLKALE